MGPTLKSARDYRPDAFCDKCVYSRQTEIAHSTNYGLFLVGPNLQLYILTIYENVEFVWHINYLRKCT